MYMPVAGLPAAPHKGGARGFDYPGRHQFGRAIHMRDIESPVVVLHQVARQLGCSVDQIEIWLEQFYGDHKEAPGFPSAEERLHWIRHRMKTEEGKSVIARAGEIAEQWRYKLH